MALSEFSPKLLNFLYELTKLDGYKSSAGIAGAIKLEDGATVTPKTVRNWFKYLHKPYNYKGHHMERKLSYFPGFFKNKLGLSMVNVFYESPSPELMKLFPLKDFVGWLYNPNTNRPVLAVEYVVPKENLGEFLKILPKIRNGGLCSEFSQYVTSPAYRIVSPLHKVIDANGNFNPERNDPAEIERQVGNLERFLELTAETKLIQAVRYNPLIIPVLAEYMYEHRSSVQVWKAIRAKLGDSVWDYMRSLRSRSEWVCLKRVQKIMENLNRFGLLNQMRVVYFPIEIRSSFSFYIVLKTKNRDELIDMTKTLSANSVFTSFFNLEGKKAFFILNLNCESLQNLLGPLSSAKIERMFFFDYFKSMELVTTTKYSVFDYVKMFDPKTCSWRYDQQAMLAELENLA